MMLMKSILDRKKIRLRLMFPFRQKFFLPKLLHMLFLTSCWFVLVSYFYNDNFYIYYVQQAVKHRS